MKRTACIISFLIMGMVYCVAQSNVGNQTYTIQMQETKDADGLLEQAKYDAIPLVSLQALVPSIGLYNLNFSSDIHSSDIVQWLNAQSTIKTFQPVVELKQRACTPNDSAFSSQYSLTKMQFDELWCYGTSGLSPSGDTLVVGVIDFGFAYGLEDLLPNVYVNQGEIPDNGKDDDQNGYTDDYYGFNARSTPGDNHQAENHGTQVISVVGAKGNNKKGISGTNQNVKMMLCSAVSSDQLLVCYYYFIKMKRSYLNTGGKQGAYLVSTNLSAGFDRQFPADLPLICQVYDSLGKMGILNAVATVNENENIDTWGDIPGLCPSDYLITVTNTNRYDQKVPDAGYSPISVDLGACGEEILMIDREGVYREESGCSFSSPHVAGAIALLYQFCPKLDKLAKLYPQDAALILKNIILTNGESLDGLKNITLTGRRLNALRSLEALDAYCKQDSLVKPEIGLLSNLKTGSFTVNFRPPSFGSYDILIYNSLGQIALQQKASYKPDSPLQWQFDLSGWPSGCYFLLIKGQSLEFSESFVKI